MSGSFQKDLDSWLSDNVVFRDESMLLTASIHRIFIAPTATLFRFDVYPTYYGSNILNGGGFLASYPIKQSEQIDRSLDAALCSFNDLFKKHPDITFHLMIPMTPYNPSVVGDLVSDSVDVSYLESHFYSQLAENCIVLNQPVTNYDDVKDQYFKNDHHWNNVGAQKGYETIATSLGFGDELLEPETVRSYPVEYWGSRAREGLDLSLGPDSFDVFAYNLPSVTVKVNQELVDDPSSFLESNRLYDAGAWSDDRFF